MKVDSQYTGANKKAWNQAIKVHRQHQPDYAQLFVNPKYSCLDDVEKRIFKKLKIKNKTVAQVCCNNGRELISIVRFGAAKGVGFDISTEAIADAKRLQSASKANCEFFETDAYKIPSKFHGQFDLVYISAGALAFLPNLPKIFKKVASLLKPQGHFVLYDMHPCMDMLASPDREKYDSKHPLELKYSYFLDQPRVEKQGLDYWGKSTYKSQPAYIFPPTLSGVLGAILHNGLNIKAFQEYTHDASALWGELKDQEITLPMSYTVVAQKVI